MKVAYLLVIMVVFATFANALNVSDFAKDNSLQEMSEVPEGVKYFIELVTSNNLMNASCNKQIAASAFGLFAIVNLIMHGDQWHHVVTRVFLFIGDLHSALVECGVL